jgi:TolB-like protein/Tfp pilus assembly protein PilF
MVLIIAAALIGLLSYVLIRRKTAHPISSSPAIQSQVKPASLKTIAVLPFKAVSADSRNESLEMGMTETLITHLSNLRQLSVRPLGSVRKYVDPQQDPVKVGQELRVDAVLDGSIQKVKERVRVTVRLTTVHDGASVWAEQFDEEFTGIFDVQDSIAEKVANTLRVKLDGGEKERLTRRYTESSEAYQLYLQAQYLWDNRTKENRQKMSDYYHQAIAKDPRFALAYVGLATLQITLVGDNQAPYKRVKSEIAANLARALELDPELAQTRNLLAEVKYQFDYDWVEAEKEFRKAIELNPNVPSIRLAYGWYLMSLGRFDEAASEMERAQELDPHSIVINRARGRLLYYRRHFDQAIQHFQRMLDAEPHLAMNHWVLAEAFEAKGMYAEAIEHNAQASLKAGADEESISQYKELFRISGWRSCQEKALEQLLNSKGYVSPNRVAKLYARLGQLDEAFIWLNKAVDERASGIPNLKVDPGFDNLHADARFAKVLQRMNLTP